MYALHDCICNHGVIFPLIEALDWFFLNVFTMIKREIIKLLVTSKLRQLRSPQQILTEYKFFSIVFFCGIICSYELRRFLVSFDPIFFCILLPDFRYILRNLNSTKRSVFIVFHNL